MVNALRPFPRFSTILDQNSPHRQDALVGIRPNLFVPSDKSLETTDQPFLFTTNIVYTTERYGLISNRILSLVTRDWAVGAFLRYGSGLPLTPPGFRGNRFISRT
jgi:hypothetical protein